MRGSERRPLTGQERSERKLEIRSRELARVVDQKSGPSYSGWIRPRAEIGRLEVIPKVDQAESRDRKIGGQGHNEELLVGVVNQWVVHVRQERST